VKRAIVSPETDRILGKVVLDLNAAAAFVESARKGDEPRYLGNALFIAQDVAERLADLLDEP